VRPCITPWKPARRFSTRRFGSSRRAAAEVRFHGNRLKAYYGKLRAAAWADVAFRKKQGFTVPVERWLADRWSAMLDRLGEDTILEEVDGCAPAHYASRSAMRWLPAGFRCNCGVFWCWNIDGEER